MTPKRTRAVGYIRVSTDKQADTGGSLEAQGAAIRAYCALYEVDLVPVPPQAGQGPSSPFAMDDGWSASTLERPALQRALAMLKSGEADAIIVSKLDRLTRSIGDLSTLVRKCFREGGSSLLSVGEQIDTRSASGRMVLGLITVVSEWEREAIGERTKAVMQHMRRQGLRVGAVPYGRRLAQVTEKGVMLEIEPSEQLTIQAAKALRAEGLSLRKVARYLEGRGMRPRRGGSWAPSQVKRMVAA